MANDFFRFQRFTVHQSRCAMKVGTDGTLLGAWASIGKSCLVEREGRDDFPTPTILDIGTGTGLIALMMAQRFPESHVTGIDIDPEAVAQAKENIAASPFRNIDIIEADARSFIVHSAKFNVIVCNPPFFEDSLESPDSQRTMARHTSALSYRDLIASVIRLLADDGEFSVVIPFDCKARLESEAALGGLFKVCECAVKTTPRKPPRRFLLTFRKHPAPLELTEGVIETAPGVRSPWYQQLTRDFYL